jgi:SPP1 gp7 family putative phage head morphogenesis protein
MTDSLTTITTRHQSHFERLKSHEAAKIDEFIKEMDASIRELLTRDDITEFSRARLEQRLRQVEKLMRGTLADYRKVWRESITEAAQYEATFEGRSLEQVVEGVELAMPTNKQIETAVFSTPIGDIPGPMGGQLLEPFMDLMDSNEIRKVHGAIRAGYAQGDTTDKIVRRIRGTKRAGYRDGLWAGTKREIEAVVRTSLQHAAGVARAEVWQKNDEVIKAVRIVAALDSRTSTICRSLDGREFPLDKGPRPPFHINCRTSVVAVLKKKYADLSLDRTRSSRDPETGDVESVSAGKTYYGWLKGQPANVQDSIVGVTRGQLLRDGGLSAKRFAELQIDKNLEPMKLADMKKLEPAAFERAGL